RGLIDDGRKVVLAKGCRIGGLPAVDAGRQAQDRTAMRHVGKAESTIAISVDRRAPGKMGVADDEAAVHAAPAQALVGVAVASALGASASEPKVSGRSLNRISIGPATNTDE